MHAECRRDATAAGMEDDTSLGGSPASARSHDSIDSAPELPAPLRQLDSAACRQLQQQYPQLTEINFSGHGQEKNGMTHARLAAGGYVYRLLGCSSFPCVCPVVCRLSAALTSGAITPLLSVYLPSLRTINFSLNHLTSVPDMGALTQLTSLDLSGNEMSARTTPDTRASGGCRTKSRDSKQQGTD